jgi:hypothetical protein
MKPEKIPLPLDIRECPLEIFALVEGFSKRPEVTLRLFYKLLTGQPRLFITQTAQNRERFGKEEL